MVPPQPLLPLLLLLLSHLPTTTPASCSGSNPTTPWGQSLSTFTAAKSHIKLDGSIYEGQPGATKCIWTISPSYKTTPTAPDTLAYTTLTFEYLFLAGGSLHIKDATGIEITPTQNNPGVFHFHPVTTDKFPITVAWFGLSDGVSSVSVEMGYDGVYLDERGWNATSNNNNVTVDYTTWVPSSYSTITSPHIMTTEPDGEGATMSTNLDYHYLLKRDPRDSSQFPSPITIMFTELQLSSAVGNEFTTLTIYDGDEITYDGSGQADNILSAYNGSLDSPTTVTPTHWTQSTQTSVLIVLTTPPTPPIHSRFQLTHQADGEGPACSKQPEIYTHRSAKFTDGTSPNKAHWSSTTCMWSIVPPLLTDNGEGLTTVTLYFNRIGVKSSASIRIYEGRDANPTSATDVLLWWCDGCGTVAPPLLVTTSGRFLVKFVSEPNPGPGFNGFEAEYYADYEKGSGPTPWSGGVGDGGSTLIMGNGRDIAPPMVTTVGDGGRTLPWGLHQSYSIIPNSLPSSLGITVALNALSLPCSVGWIGFYEPDGTAIREFCKEGGEEMGGEVVATTPLEWIISEGSEMLVEVHTNDEPPSTPSTGAYVSFDYISDAGNYECGYPLGRSPGVFTAASMVFKDSTRSGLAMEAGLECVWVVRPEVAEGLTVSGLAIVLERLDVRGGGLYFYAGDVRDTDVVLTQDRQIWGCDGCSVAPEKLHTDADVVTVVFYTGHNSNLLGYGFEVRYHAVIGRDTIGLGGGVEKLAAPFAEEITGPSADSDNLKLAANLDYKVVVRVPIDLGTVNVKIAVREVYLPCESGSMVSFYDGDCTGSGSCDFLQKYCGTSASELSQWIVSGSNLLTVVIETDDYDTVLDKRVFKGSYFTNHFMENAVTTTCGLSKVPFVSKAESMYFTDGTPEYTGISANSNCSWILGSENEESDEIVVTFSRVKLPPSATLRLYHGDEPRRENLLWECYGCQSYSSDLQSLKGKIFLEYYSGGSGGSGGEGFAGYYHTIKGTPETAAVYDGIFNTTLIMPDVRNLNSLDNFAWVLPAHGSTGETETLTVGKYTGAACGETFGDNVVDGSAGVIEQIQKENVITSCGMVGHHNRSGVALSGEYSTLHYNHEYSSSGRRLFYSPSVNESLSNEDVCVDDIGLGAKVASIPLHNSEVCQYIITPEYPKAKYTKITIDEIDFPNGASMGIYSGTSEFGRPLYLCGRSFVYDYQLFNDFSPEGPIPPKEVFAGTEDGMPDTLKSTWWRPTKDSIEEGRGRQEIRDFYWAMDAFNELCLSVKPGLTVKTSCGNIFVRIIHNGTETKRVHGEDYDVDDMTLKVHYEWEEELQEERPTWDLCYDHPEWTQTPYVKVASVTEQVLVILGIIFGVISTIAGIGGGYYYFEVHLPNSQISSNVPVKMVAAKKIPHAGYTPIMNAIKNKFLKVGECTICFGDDEKVFNLPGCAHKICMDCLRSYVHTALGDASMFPIKCPMHHTGCLTVLEAKFAQRVLNKDEFERFNLFNDRAVYGDGMACIFCGNFVIFPERMGGVMVACPYCRQRFCMKCKIAWHLGVDCTEEGKDDLEEWRKSHGATRCPGCFKVIEKDDPETCNHMVHKAVDSIPCIQERTDFCYCCGLEVTPDYPHYEAVNPSVNHFPDGVYNDCRVVLEGFSVAIQNKPSNRRRATTGGGRRGGAHHPPRRGGAGQQGAILTGNRNALVVPVEEDVVEAPVQPPRERAGERYEYRDGTDVVLGPGDETARRRDRNAGRESPAPRGAGAAAAARDAVDGAGAAGRRGTRRGEAGGEEGGRGGEGRGGGGRRETGGPVRRVGAQNRRHSSGTGDGGGEGGGGSGRLRRAHHGNH